MLVQAEWHNAQSETPWPSESWGRRPAQPDRIQVQLGFTMFEKMHLDSGQVTNASLADYKIPGIWDVPAVMMNEALDAFQRNGPFGAKGAAESATLCLSPGPSCSVRRKCASSVLHLAKSKKFVHPLPMSRPRQAHRSRVVCGRLAVIIRHRHPHFRQLTVYSPHLQVIQGAIEFAVANDAFLHVLIVI